MLSKPRRAKIRQEISWISNRMDLFGVSLEKETKLGEHMNIGVFNLVDCFPFSEIAFFFYIHIFVKRSAVYTILCTFNTSILFLIFHPLHFSQIMASPSYAPY